MFERTRHAEDTLLKRQTDVFREYGMSDTEIAEIVRKKLEIEHENTLPSTAPHPLDYYWQTVKQRQLNHDA